MTLEKGRIYGLVGQSGSGKSTLLRCINGLIPYDGGSLRVDGQEVAELSGKALRQFRQRIGMIFQSFSLLNRLTVYENIALPMRCWGYSREQIAARVAELLELVHITEKRDAYPRALSGGQKQRVAIARALAMEPEILLCDEATSALDPSIAEAIMELLVEINRATGITVVVVTHQFSIVKRYCQEVYVLSEGRITAAGKCSQIFANPPSSLRAIMEKTENSMVCYSEKRLRITAPAERGADTIIGRLCLETQVACSVLSASQEQYADAAVFACTIGIAAADFAKVTAFLDAAQIAWEEE